MAGSPKTIYQNYIAQGELQQDPHQSALIDQFEILYQAIIKFQARSALTKFIFKNDPLPNLYIWGGVGLGKTLMMDIFFAALITPRKVRLHFHRFMNMIQGKLRELEGTEAPLVTIAKELAAQYDVICFDEFFVSDIGDAMILAGLLRALWSCGICLVTTSNAAPDDLYRHGFQRQLFLPAIALIKKHMQIFEMAGEQDYRQQHASQHMGYYWPLNTLQRSRFNAFFSEMTVGEKVVAQQVLQINHRPILTVAAGEKIVWFEFKQICHSPRSQVDYLALTDIYHTVFISDIPVIEAQDYNTIRYLINLVDVFYDAKMRLVLLAASDIPDLYPAGLAHDDFCRTASRLTEMRSQTYWTEED